MKEVLSALSWPRWLPGLLLAFVVSNARGQATQSILSCALTNYTGYVIFADATTNNPSFHRERLLVSARTMATNPTAGTVDGTYYLSFRVLDTNGTPFPIYNHTGVTTNSGYTLTVTNSQFLSANSAVFKTNLGSIRPAARMSPHMKYSVELRLFRTGGIFTGDSSNTLAQTFYHFTNFVSSDAAFNVLSEMDSVSVIEPVLSRKLSEAERGAGMTVDEKGGGFRPLFDGRTLNGWRSDETNWVAIDGAIYRATNGGPLRYEAETVPNSFELRFEWKVPLHGDGGVNYRPGSVEYQVIDGSNRIAQARGDRRPGALVGCIAPGGDASRPVGEWNEGRIICRGTGIEHWLNGHRLFRFDYNDARFAASLAQLDALDKRTLGRSAGNVRARGGYLQLLDQNAAVWYRHLRWRKLD